MHFLETALVLYNAKELGRLCDDGVADEEFERLLRFLESFHPLDLFSTPGDEAGVGDKGQVSWRCLVC
jgi:hypothetical protein